MGEHFLWESYPHTKQKYTVSVKNAKVVMCGFLRSDVLVTQKIFVHVFIRLCVYKSKFVDLGTTDV